MKKLFLVVIILALASFAQAAPIIIGAPLNSNNCYPFGCAYVGEYQQVYTSSAFSGPMTITGLEFYNTRYDSGATSMNSGTWAISLSTSSADWNTLSSTFASNIGSDNTLVFSGNLYQPWTFGNTLTITFSAPFSYNPANGNLLMDVYVTGAAAEGGALFLDASLDTVMGRVYYDGDVGNGYGLVTGFETGSNTVPDPGSSLLLLGMGLAGLRAWKNRLG